MREAFKVVFADGCLTVLNKTAKILVQPAGKIRETTLTSLLEQKTAKKMFPCHRLDRETSGLIIYAASRLIQRKVMEEFRERRVRKKYTAFVRGKLKLKSGLLEGYIIDTAGKRFGEKPKPAQTTYKVLAGFKDWSLLELKPLTGRTNQLRIQLARIGHPILGERKYARGRDFKVKFRRLALHAFFLSFRHPLGRKPLTFQIDLAPDMLEFLNKHTVKTVI